MILLGSIENSGSIDADLDGISLSVSTITNSIQNSNSIVGGSDGIRIEDSTVNGITNSVGATIVGGTFSIFISNPVAPITITNAGLLGGEVQLNNGTLDLNGNSSRVDGVISGSATSTVNVNGEFSTEGGISVGTLAITSSGRLALNHAVTTPTAFNNAGTLAIADDTARTVTGDCTQTGGGILEIGATSDSSFGQLSVTGAADFSASDKLHVTIGAGESLAEGMSFRTWCRRAR